MLRMRLRDRRGRLAHAEADLEHDRRDAAEGPREVERRAGERYAVARQQRLARALLRRRHAPLAQHVAAHRTPRAGRPQSPFTVKDARSRAPAARRPARVRRDAATSCAACLRRRRVYSHGQRFGVLPRAAASDHAGVGFHASSLRTPSRLTRHTASSLSQPSGQKSAVTRRWRSGDSDGLGGKRDTAPVGALHQHEARLIAIGGIEQDGVDRDRGSPTARTIGRR